MNIKKLILLPIILSSVAMGSASAGEEYSEEAILLEISYLAKKLLDMSGKDTYTVEQPAYTKAFIGICTSINEQGILLTCVTPGTEAENAGLRTGDIITSMNGVSVLDSDTKKTKSAYYEVIHNMEIGDVIKMTLVREDKTLNKDVGVGQLSHPEYSCTVKK